MDIKMITRENIPCWYELSWQKEPPAIRLRVHRDFIGSVKPIFEEAPIVIDLKEEFKFKRFIGSFDGNFGFDNAFIRRGEKERFIEFIVNIPEVKKWTDEICGNCKGTGKEKFVDFERECLFCEGRGKKYLLNWQPAYAISASFTVFTTLAQFPQIKTSAPFPQLMTIKTVTARGHYGGAIEGEFSIPLVKWLASLFETGPILETVDAMKIAYNRMLGLREYHLFYFKASVDYKGGWLNVSCPGDTCGLNPVYGAGYDMERGLGYEFTCHNTDTPMQQITLLAGLAALYDKARKELEIK